ncbi:MAG: sigma 54-interacting transcriptional regulator [Peptostreptococcaceae bacterium]|nr:sigma 54-interacting transcriptional regulator [Peptostreptococcaceae bacterium]
MSANKIYNRNNQINDAWSQFMESGNIDRDIIRKEIADSWIRSRKEQVNPMGEGEKNSKSKTLKDREVQLRPLLRIAKPFMESLYNISGSHGLLVRLTDPEGYVVECLGDEDSVEAYKKLNLYKGNNVKEETIGTNAIGIALNTRNPIQVFAAEHYAKRYHKFTSSACPIKNAEGELLGILSMTDSYEKVHLHTLGMVVASSVAIEKQFKIDKINRQLRIANHHFSTIIEQINEGLICIDNEGVITDVNLIARHILKRTEKEIIGKDISKMVKIGDRLKSIGKNIAEGHYNNEELEFILKNGKRVVCIATIASIKDIEKDVLEGVILTFHEVKTVHNLVNRIVGSQARFTFTDIMGESEAIKKSIKIAEGMTQYNTTVLLQGESGTGKELFAQSIHNAGPRRKHPFIFLNCGAIPRDLVASELFGYIEGAFTGAKRGGHPGKFELADGGTIFLDEIGDMPLDTQANLLRVLETQEVVRVGGHDVIPVDVRVIAATHKDLKGEVEKGNFREDLFYRLNVMPIMIPPLRERKKDFKPLISYFMEKFSRQMGKDIRGIDDAFFERMSGYPWPGNVRELQNVMQQIISVVKDGEVLSAEDIPQYMKATNLLNETDSQNQKFFTLREIESMAIHKTIEKANGNLSKTARILGISRSSLYRKMKEYDINTTHNGTCVL